VDAPVKRANTQLVRSVPKMYKQSLKELLAPYGFKGFKIAELTPNRTRRAQVGGWADRDDRTRPPTNRHELKV